MFCEDDIEEGEEGEEECEAPYFPPGEHPASRVVVCATDRPTGGASAATAMTTTTLELPTLIRGEPDEVS